MKVKGRKRIPANLHKYLFFNKLHKGHHRRARRRYRRLLRKGLIRDPSVMFVPGLLSKYVRVSVDILADRFSHPLWSLYDVLAVPKAVCRSCTQSEKLKNMFHRDLKPLNLLYLQPAVCEGCSLKGVLSANTTLFIINDVFADPASVLNNPPLLRYLLLGLYMRDSVRITEHPVSILSPSREVLLPYAEALFNYLYKDQLALHRQIIDGTVEATPEQLDSMLDMGVKQRNLFNEITSLHIGPSIPTDSLEKFRDICRFIDGKCTTPSTTLHKRTMALIANMDKATRQRLYDKLTLTCQIYHPTIRKEAASKILHRASLPVKAEVPKLPLEKAQLTLCGMLQFEQVLHLAHDSKHLIEKHRTDDEIDSCGISCEECIFERIDGKLVHPKAQQLHDRINTLIEKKVARNERRRHKCK